MMKSLVILSALGMAHTAAVLGRDTSDSPFPMPLCNGIKIEDATISELQRWMSLGSLTSQDLVKCYTERIAQTNGSVCLPSIIKFSPLRACVLTS